MAAATVAAQRQGDALWPAEWKEGAGEKTIAERQKEAKPLKLYCSWFCPFAQRAFIVLEEKGLDYQYVEINPYEVDPARPGGYTKKQLPLEAKRAANHGFIAASPRGLVPAIDNAGERVWESWQVLEYVEEKFPQGPRLMPSDPHERAMVRIWADYCTSRIQKAFYAILMQTNSELWDGAKAQFFEECRGLARAMSDDGPYFLGDRFTLVDIALAPFWGRFHWVGSFYRQVEFPDDADFARLAKWWDAVRARPAVARTIVCLDRLISSYSQYATNEGTSDYAKGMQSALAAAPAKRKADAVVQ